MQAYPSPMIIIINYESHMNNFLFSLSIFETQVYSVSWASLELIIYVSQADLKVLSVLLSQSLKWWDYPYCAYLNMKPTNY